MSRELFVDTSGFYAILAKRDPKCQAANRILDQAKAQSRRLVTTDYVLDETATLLKTRHEVSLVATLFESVQASFACQLVWTDAQQFAAVQSYFLKHMDQEWSFTDCVSFCVMKEMRLREALTTDHHFEQAGFVALLK